MVEELTVEVPQKPRLFRRLAWYRRRVEALEQQTVVDALTGLRNQRALWRELGHRLPLCSDSHPLAVLMLDFDVFKEINENYGHETGDAVLRRAASVLRAASGSPRLAFRYGGEEFVVLSDVGEDEAAELAESIRADIARQNGPLPAVTVSCGVAALEEPVQSWIALDRADTALHRAKRGGRNRVVVAGREDLSPDGYLAEDLEHETARRAAMALAVAALEARDTDTAHHSDDVVTLCDAVGRRLDLDDRTLEHLRAGAQLHDVGKVAIPSSILNKPTALTDDEWNVIREHTVMGERILRAVPEMAEVATIVRHSHEHWDGSGYPDGLAGDHIPLASRVILCADAFHAIRSDRPYRRGRDASKAIAEIEACAGTQFDPAVVDAFLDVAGEARTGHPGGVNGFRKRRLVVLLTTLIIGGGSAVAGIPEVRDALKSVFGTSLGPSQAAPNVTAPTDFGLGPLGDLLSLEGKLHDARGDHAKRAAHGKAADGEHRSGDAAGSHDRAKLSAPGSSGFGTGGTGELRGTGGHGPSEETTGGQPSPPAVPETGGGTQDEATQTNGKGRALGRDVSVPRRPAESPSDHPGGRTDPPALGRNNPAHSNGNANGHSK